MIWQDISSEVEESREIAVFPKRTEIMFVLPESYEWGSTPGIGEAMGTML